MEHPDFVYVDGPPLISHRSIVFDVAEIFPKPEVFVVDGRNDQVAFMRTMMGALYDIEQDDKNFRTTFRRKRK